MALKNAWFRLGLSATPLDRDDRASLRTLGAIGPVLFELSPQVLIDEGVLAQPDIRMIDCHQGALHDASWRQVYDDLIVRSGPRNKLLAEMAERAEKPCLVFVDEIDHGQRVMREIAKRGMNVEFVWGDHSIAWRRGKVKDLVRGQLDVLVCNTIFQEGIDIPELAAVVMGAGKSSVVATKQRIGRGARSNLGTKPTFQVWDVRDRGQKWLSTHARDRKSTYESDGYIVKTEWPGRLPP